MLLSLFVMLTIVGIPFFEVTCIADADTPRLFDSSTIQRMQILGHVVISIFVDPSKSETKMKQIHRGDSNTTNVHEG